MKHIREYEDREITSLIDDLESVGHGGLIGFMWIDFFVPTREHAGFLVIGENEQECLDLIIKSKILFHPETPKLGFKGTFANFLDDMFDKSLIRDSGHYPGLRARGNKKMVKYWSDPYTMNPKYCYDQAKEYFRNADEVFSKEEPESRIWEPK